jgi:hypothetical protein
MITKAMAINSLVPTAEFCVFSDGTIQWDKPTSAPVTDAQIDAEIIRLQETEANKQAIKDSATAKLKKLGLTDDEISALKGTL